MRQSAKLLIFLSITSWSGAWAIGNGVPRGVGPEFTKFYRDPSAFKCISQPSIEIPFTAVNDDYCDCPDGSDEPGTSACSYLSHLSPFTLSGHTARSDVDFTPALPGYYCTNKGHIPLYLPFQRVNDGICDYDICCDGSDEWAHVGGIKCEDKCKETGKVWREQEKERARALNVALKKKKELVSEAEKLWREVENRIGDLETEVKAQELKIQSLEVELEQIQNIEKKKAMKRSRKGKAALLAGIAKTRVEELRNALEVVRDERDESRSRVKELEDILSRFKIEYNPNFNDDGVKRAVRSWEEYAAKGTASDYSENAAPERDLDEVLQPDGESSGIDWKDWEDESDRAFIYKFLAYFSPSLVNHLETRLDAFKEFLVAKGILAESKHDSSSESPAVIQARDAVNSAKSSLTSTQNSLDDHRSDLVRDYGSDSVFRPLKGVCIRKDSGEYTYEHCFLDKTLQIPKKGGASVTMGNFVRIETVTVDEVNSSGRIYPVEKTVLNYANGQMCWSGPARSTAVTLECGQENEILKVMENEKCVYSMIVTTPAVCSNGEDKQDASANRDEL